MKIEKINDNQIRCTLNRSDLAERELKLSELAYGSEKARNLFNEMMKQASCEFGFEADDIPLMIEAIPISSESIVLLITKVENPDELDTHFSRFTQSHADLDNLDDSSFDDDLNSLMSNIQELRDSLELSEDELSRLEELPDKEPTADSSSNNEDSAKNLMRAFTFDSIDIACAACSRICNNFKADSYLFKDESKKAFILVITNYSGTIAQFNNLSHMLLEFGQPLKTHCGTLSYYMEHFKPFIQNNAVNVLGNM